MERIRVLIADDHALFREGLHGLLDSVAQTEVVGEATAGAEAIREAKTLQPDVILMDIKKPRGHACDCGNQPAHQHSVGL
jgi:DNA-binding NarL/FixJ family response regulator